MTARPPRTLAVLAVTATCLLLAACSSGATTPSNTAVGHTHSTAITAATPPGAPTAAPTVGPASDAATPTVPAAGTSACALVSEQQLTALLGTDPGPGKAGSDSSTTSCAYTRGVAVSIVVDRSGGKILFDGFCPNQAQSNTRSVSGVADGACYTIVGGTGPIAAMYILKGTAVMSINIQAGLDAKITASALIALGKVAAARL